MGKICVFLAEGMEEIEALTVVDICRRAKLEVATVSITGDKRVTSSHQITVEADELLENIDFDDVDMIVLPGGMPGTKNLEACEPLMKQVEAFDKQGRNLSAICAAPSIFGHKGMLKGRRACCWPDFESHLEGAEVVRESVAEDGHFITSRGMGTAIDFSLAIVSRMKNRETAEQIAKAIIYK